MSKENLSMFKSSDIRTKECNLTEEIKQKLTTAIVSYLKRIKTKSVVVCRDTRLYVPLLAEITANKLIECGIDVLINPVPVSSCQFYYTCMKHKDSAGLMFTASHNPGEYTGLKMIGPELEPIAMTSGPGGGLKTVRDYYLKDIQLQKNTKPGKLTVVNEIDSYIDYSMKLAGVKEGSLKGLKLQFEFLNGSAGMEEALAFQKAGAEVCFRHIIPNGLFPCGDPNPIIEKSIAPAREAMKNGNYNLAFCFDGDGDRLDIMDCNGNQIVPSQNMSFLAPYIKKEIFKDTKGSIYTDVKALPTSLIAIAKEDVTPHTIRSGHSFIKAKLRENFKNGFFAAVEESAHYYMCFPYDVNKITDNIEDFAITESSLFFALLTARCYKDNPDLYKPEKKPTVFREKEWSVSATANPQAMEKIIEDINSLMMKKGAVLTTKMDDNSDLETSLLRVNLPETFTKDTVLEGKNWLQIVQRISCSEDSLIRFEVSSNSQELCKTTKEEISRIVALYL